MGFKEDLFKIKFRNDTRKVSNYLESYEGIAITQCPFKMRIKDIDLTKPYSNIIATIGGGFCIRCPHIKTWDKEKYCSHPGAWSKKFKKYGV